MTVSRPTEHLALVRLRHYKRPEPCQPDLIWYVVRINVKAITADVIDHAASRESADQRIDALPRRPGDLICVVPGLSKEHVRATMQSWLTGYTKK